MPRYDFKNLKTGEVKEYTMSWKDLDQFKKDNPDLQQQIGTINHSYNSSGSATLKKAGDRVYLQWSESMPINHECQGAVIIKDTYIKAVI